MLRSSMDRVSRAVRSRNMSAIRSTGTKPELVVRELLRKTGLEFQEQCESLPGRPDFVLPAIRTVVFVHGCFWHGHRCRRSHTPKTRKSYWAPKIERNRRRDRNARRALRRRGWTVVVLWECRLGDNNEAKINTWLTGRTSAAAKLHGNRHRPFLPVPVPMTRIDSPANHSKR